MLAPELPLPSALLADVLWSRRDEPCFDHCRVMKMVDFYAIQGSVLTIVEGNPYQVQYLVQCDLDWTTRAAFVRSTHGSVSRHLEIQRDDAGTWSRDGVRIPQLDGLVDVDLQITPATNTLPMRRLQLEVGGEASADAAWVLFPDLTLERLPQRYTRTAERSYAYESHGGSFRARIDVDDEAVVVRYGDMWERIAPVGEWQP